MPLKAKKPQQATAEPVDGKGDKLAATTMATAPARTTFPGADYDREDAEVKATTGTGKPDQAAFHSEQARIKAEIEALQVKLVQYRYLSVHYRWYLIWPIYSQRLRRRSP